MGSEQYRYVGGAAIVALHMSEAGAKEITNINFK